MLVKILTDNKWFIIPYVCVLFFVLPVFLLFEKAELHLMLNGYHSLFFDYSFKLVTWLGHGVFICAVCFVFSFFSLRNALYLLSAYLATGIFVQFLKLLIFPEVMRPVKYFQNIAELHLVEGVKLLGFQSFPSGHATSAFVLFTCLALLEHKKWIKLACMILAWLVAYSRVYLSQHFLIDVYVGSLIGITGAVGMYFIFYNSDMKWHNRNIITLFKPNE